MKYRPFRTNNSSKYRLVNLGVWGEKKERVRRERRLVPLRAKVRGCGAAPTHRGKTLPEAPLTTALSVNLAVTPTPPEHGTFWPGAGV